MADRGRQGVQKGGFWESKQGTYSKETQNLLKEMMKESKLTNFQQRHLTAQITRGEALPKEGVNPTTSARGKRPQVQAPAPMPKVLNPRNYSGGMRKKEDIELSGAYVRPNYVPKNTPCRNEKDKIRLANMMAYGEDLPPPTQEKMMKRLNPPDDEPQMDRFDELQQEVEERQQFLNEMEQLGKGKQYRPIIDTEISQKIREMEVIDKKRTAELNKLIEAERKGRDKEAGIPDVEGAAD